MVQSQGPAAVWFHACTESINAKHLIGREAHRCSPFSYVIARGIGLLPRRQTQERLMMYAEHTLLLPSNGVGTFCAAGVRRLRASRAGRLTVAAGRAWLT